MFPGFIDLNLVTFSGLWAGEVVLTEMGGVPIPESNYNIIFQNQTGMPVPLLEFTVEWVEHAFVHDIHFECDTDILNGCDNQGLIEWRSITLDGLVLVGVWVPEPATLSLLGLGLVGLGLRGRKAA